MKKNKIYNLIIKRFFDIFISLLLIFILSPILLLIGLFIKLDSKGRIFFTQERVGKNQKIFKIIKFRTMIQGAETKGDGLFVYSEQDNRITAVGKFLRNTSLDELPQLFNVLNGTMSLVGPRPPVTYFPYKVNEYNDEFKIRFNVKPGITGLSQVIHRTNQPWDVRISTDIEYINKISFFTDLKILILTAVKIVKKTNIYPESKEKIKNKE